MHPDLWIGKWHFSAYWVIAHLSFLPVVFYGYYAGVLKEGLPKWKVTLFIVLMFFAQFYGGGIIPFCYKWAKAGTAPPLHELWTSGRYFHSVLLGGLIFFIFYAAKVFKRPVFRLLDYFAVGACIMSAIGRIGCFMQGCCGGKPAPGFLGMKFPTSAVPVYPTQLYQFFFESFLLLPFLLIVQKNKSFDGETFWLFLLVYSVFRFIVEFIRTNPVAWLGLTHAQLASMVLIVISGIFWFRGVKKASGNLA